MLKQCFKYPIFVIAVISFRCVDAQIQQRDYVWEGQVVLGDRETIDRETCLGVPIDDPKHPSPAGLNFTIPVWCNDTDISQRWQYSGFLSGEAPDVRFKGLLQNKANGHCYRYRFFEPHEYYNAGNSGRGVLAPGECPLGNEKVTNAERIERIIKNTKLLNFVHTIAGMRGGGRPTNDYRRIFPESTSFGGRNVTEICGYEEEEDMRHDFSIIDGVFYMDNSTVGHRQNPHLWGCGKKMIKMLPSFELK